MFEMNLKFLLTSKKRISMRRFFLLVTCSLLLSACSKYQYVFIDSHLSQNEKKEFIVENDTVTIKYSFAGVNFPITLSIYNKLQKPLYIDWGRSVVVLNGIQITGPYDRDGLINFIAPKSGVIVISNSLKNQFFDLDINDPKIKLMLTGGSMKGVRYVYNEKSTPLSFRNVLALTTNEDFSAPTFYDYSFWVSDIIQTPSGPSSMTYKPLNLFVICKLPE
jgi:hypothetical protein